MKELNVSLHEQVTTQRPPSSTIGVGFGITEKTTPLSSPELAVPVSVVSSVAEVRNLFLLSNAPIQLELFKYISHNDNNMLKRVEINQLHQKSRNGQIMSY